MSKERGIIKNKKFKYLNYLYNTYRLKTIKQPIFNFILIRYKLIIK